MSKEIKEARLENSSVESKSYLLSIDTKKNNNINNFLCKKSLGLIIYGILSIIGIYFRFTGTSISIQLGDTGSIGKLLLTSITLIAGRGSLYLGIYGLVATVYRKKMIDFYTYYIIFSILVGVISLLYFMI